MSDSQSGKTDIWQRLALVLGFVLVVMGLANNLPNIPGLLESVRAIPGLGELPRLYVGEGKGGREGEGQGGREGLGAPPRPLELGARARLPLNPTSLTFSPLLLRCLGR